MRLKRGSILIIALWLVAVLTVLAVAVSRHLSIELRLVRRRLDLARAQAMAEGGIRYALLLLERDAQQEQQGQPGPTPPADWLGDDWAQASEALAFEAGAVSAVTGSVSLAITDEERRLGLNAAEAAQLTALGLSPAAAQAIVDYWDPADPAEEDRSAAPPYAPKNGPLRTLEELRLIPAVRQELESQPTLRPLLDTETTVYLPQAAMNVNTASEAVLAAVGMPADLRASVAAFRTTTGAEEPRYFYEADGQLQSTVPFVAIDELRAFKAGYPPLGTVSQTFTVTASASLAREGRTYTIRAVVRRSADCPAVQETPRAFELCVLAWNES